jgi:hypothetical protein
MHPGFIAHNSAAVRFSTPPSASADRLAGLAAHFGFRRWARLRAEPIAPAGDATVSVRGKNAFSERDGGECKRRRLGESVDGIGIQHAAKVRKA